MSRIGDWCQTFTGRQFWPLDPRPEEIAIEDIAHHLALVCRFGGASRVHYSVAEHSVRVSLLLPPGVAMAGLLHDASEAYLSDVVRPLKRLGEFAGYREIEDRLQRAINARFGLSDAAHEWAAVKRADEVLLVTEKRDLMAPPPAPWGVGQNVPAEPLADRIVPWRHDTAETFFLRRFVELGGVR